MYHLKQPFPIRIGMGIGMHSFYSPTSYELETDGLVTLDDWQIVSLPQFTFIVSSGK